MGRWAWDLLGAVDVGEQRPQINVVVDLTLAAGHAGRYAEQHQAIFGGVRHDVPVPDKPSLKYAHVESERCFLLDGLPPSWQEVPAKTIIDRYVPGTRLRLRMVQAVGEPTVWKLGQKIRFDPSSPKRVAHTTIYLDEAEASTLAALPADELFKTRRTCSIDGHLWAIDEFLGPLTGLVLAELDLGEAGAMPGTMPFPVVAEVSGDERFSGGSLAQLSADEAAGLMASIRH